jgi:hypothetical protein
MAVTEAMVRKYFRDYDNENMKHLAEFFKKEEIEMAIDFANEQVDYLPPLVRNVSSKNMPNYIMIIGTAAQLMQIKINNLTINYTSGVTEHGVQLSIGEELGVFKSLMSDFQGMFKEAVYTYKKAQDFKGATGNIASPFNKYKNCRRG